MVFEDKKKYADIANCILNRYDSVLGLGNTLELLHLSENLTWLVRDASGRKKAVLRISRPGYHSMEELQAELLWMERVAQDTELSLRAPIADGEGSYIQTVSMPEDEGLYYGVMFTYLEGIPLEKQSPEKLSAWYEKLGEIAAVLHRQVRKWDGAGKLPRFHWNYETILGEHAIWGDWRKAPSLTPGMITVLRQADSIICWHLSEYGMTQDNYGLIHGDLRGSNVLIEGSMMKIIDFDDCGYGWYMQDLAASMSFMETEPILTELIRSWLTGYQKYARLSRQDKGMIDTFIMMRRLQLLAWMVSHGNSDAACRFRDGFVEKTVGLAQKYVKLG